MQANPRFDLSGQTIIITGGGKGIGKVYAREFARVGARVVAADIDGGAANEVAEAIRAEGGDCIGITTDVSDAASVEAMARATLEAYGRIDVLINNASLMSTLPPPLIPRNSRGRVGPGDVREPEEPVPCCRAVVPRIARPRRGKIVNISSSRVWEGIPNRLHYTTSKQRA